MSETGDSLRNSLFLHSLVAEIVETYGVTRSWGRGLRAEKTRPASSACSITSSKSRTSIWDSKGFDSRFPLLSSFCCIAAEVRCFISSCPGPSVIFAFRPIAYDETAFALIICFNPLMFSSTTQEIRTKSEPHLLTTELLQTGLHCSKALLKETTQFQTQEHSYKTLTVRIFVERRGRSDRGQISSLKKDWEKRTSKWYLQTLKRSAPSRWQRAMVNRAEHQDDLPLPQTVPRGACRWSHYGLGFRGFRA